MIAFMNGYSSAIGSDIETIRALKEDQGKLKKYSQLAVKSYMEKVRSLNQGETVTGKKENPVGDSSHSLPL